jgi:hypothetical protein
MSYSQDAIFDSISGYAVSGKATEDAYGRLNESASLTYQAFRGDPDGAFATFEADCRRAEDDFMETNYAGDPNAKHDKGKRAGEWKYRSYLPGAYSTAKTELSKALQVGVDPKGLGKTEIAKQRKAKTTTPSTPIDRVNKALSQIMNAINELPQAEAEAVRDHIRDVLSL